jgi:hypothetical protein
MIEALTEHAHLDDDVEFVPVELGEHLFVGPVVFAAVDVVGPLPALAVRCNDLLGFPWS